MHEILRWVCLRWRLLFVLFLPLVLLPLPIVENSTVRFHLFISNVTFVDPFVARQMWLYRLDHVTFLDLRSNSTSSDVTLSVNPVSYGSSMIRFRDESSRMRLIRQVWSRPRRSRPNFFRILLHFSSVASRWHVRSKRSIYIDASRSSFSPEWGHRPNGTSTIETHRTELFSSLLARSMAGLMGVTAFLSMWINNSAAASIMLPVALAICQELEKHAKHSHRKKRGIVNGTRDRSDRFSLCPNSPYS